MAPSKNAYSQFWQCYISYFPHLLVFFHLPYVKMSMLLHSLLSLFHYCQNDLTRKKQNISILFYHWHSLLLPMQIFFFLLHKKKYNIQVSRHCQKYGEKKRQYQKIREKDCSNFEIECKFKDVFSATLKF